MEHLTKSQIVLLTLFTSMVASMATGIVVVTLMQQSPEPATQTLTKVVERTIEKIASVPAGTISTPTTPPTTEDLTIAAIDRNIKSTVAFKVIDQAGASHSAGVGTIVSADGLVITDTSNFGEGVLTTSINGVPFALQVVSNENNNYLGLGKLVPTGTATTTVAFVPVTLGDADRLKLGQTAIAIGGWDAKTILNGFVNNLETRSVVDKDKKTETKVVSNIGMSVRPGASSNGAPIINLNGEVVGFLSINEVAGTQVGVPAAEAKRILDAATKPAAPKTN